MYSRNSYSRQRQEEPQTIPPRYSGVRFSRDRRSDGREVRIEEPMTEPGAPETPPLPAVSGASSRDSLSKLLAGIGEDDILIVALIIVLAAEDAQGNREAILLLILLLCIR